MQEPSLERDVKSRLENYLGLGIELISLLFLARLMVDTVNRMLVPYIPQFSSGLGLSIAAYSWILALRSLSGFISPFIGFIADRYGRRIVITMSLAICGIGLLAVSFSKGWWSILPILLISLTTSAFLPVQKAYVSDQAHYERRGRALASVEASFSIAGILGLPFIGWLIDTWGWQMPFLVMAMTCFTGAAIVGIRLPSSLEYRGSNTSWLTFQGLLKKPRVPASMAVAFGLCLAFGIFMTFWGIWLTEDFGFTAVGLGLTGTSIGVAELAGVILSGLFIDRMGKRRGSLIGLFAAAISFSMISLVQENITWIKVMLVLTAVLLEFSFTSLYPLFADQAPEARATLFALVALSTSIGIGLGSPIAASLWRWRGLSAVTFVGGAILTVTFVLIWIFLKEGSEGAE